MNREIRRLVPKIVRILRKYGVAKAGIFGSSVRGEQKKNSDVDILILPPKNMSLLGFVHLKHELEEKLGKKVDLVSYRGVHPYLKDQILGEEIRVI
jgi:uncharacterized protein